MRPCILKCFLKELVANYLCPLGIVSLLVSSFDVGGERVGILMFEQIETERCWMIEEISFASSLGDLLSLGMEAQERRHIEDNLRVEQMQIVVAQHRVGPRAHAFYQAQRFQ